MSLRPRQWNNLLEALSHGTCVVLLGPTISTSEKNGLPLIQQFAEELSKELDDEEVAYDVAHKHNLTYIMQRYTTIKNVAPSDPGFEAKRFFSSYREKFNEVQKTLAELPLKLVINTSPDDAMVHALKKAGKYETTYAWYDYRKEEKVKINKPSIEAPLVYNLFGHYEKAMSLVLTESDQVEFMKNVIRDQPPLPPKLISQLDSHKTYLFLGFDWEQWNLRLLLEGLNLEKEANVLAHSRMEGNLQSKTRDFYESSFSFSFITDHVGDFVQELKSKYAEHIGEEVEQKNLYIVSDPKEDHFREELCKNLKSLPFNIMHDGLIEIGEEVEAAVASGMNNADLILLLISADFLASDKIHQREWKIVLDRFEKNQSKVVPIVTRACNWQDWEDGALTKMDKILPRDGQEFKVFSTWEQSDEAYDMIVKEIRKLSL